MRIIFLDVDGVLNCDDTTERFHGYIGIDPKLVEKLKELYDKSNEKETTRIVISSSWRLEKIRKHILVDGSYDYLVKTLEDAGMEIDGVTPDIAGWYRGTEIQTWLKENEGNDITSFVILDDESFNIIDIGYGKNFVYTDFAYGLRDQDVERALKILDGEEVEETKYHYENI